MNIIANMKSSKELFVFKIQSVSEVITNSSSELYVFEGNNEKEIIGILDSIYPNWRDEYYEPESVADFNSDSLRNFLDNINELGSRDYYWMKEDEFNSKKQKEELCCCKFAKSLGLKPSEAFENWEKWNPTDRKLDWENRHLELSDKFMEKYKEKAEKEKTYALYSIDENPNWDYQELLMEVAERYHLG